MTKHFFFCLAFGVGITAFDMTTQNACTPAQEAKTVQTVDNDAKYVLNVTQIGCLIAKSAIGITEPVELTVACNIVSDVATALNAKKASRDAGGQ